MKFNKKTNQFILFALLILIIVTGVFIFFSGKNGKSSVKDLNADNSTIDTATKDNSTDISEVSTDKNNKYYVEKLAYEQISSITNSFIFRYKNKAVKFIYDDNITKLVDIFNDEIINDFSSMQSIELLMKDVYFIDDEMNFYTAEYNDEKNQAIIKKFNPDGNKTDINIVLKDFQGAIFDYGKKRNASFHKLMVDSSYIYLMLGTDAHDILQIFDMDGNLFRTYEKVVDFDMDKNGNLYISGFFSGIGSEFEKVNLKTGEVAYCVDPNSFSYNYISYSESDNSLYYLDRDKICKYNAENGEFIEEVLIFGKDTSYFADDFNNLRISCFAVDNNLNLFLQIIMVNDINDIFDKCYKYELIKGSKDEKQVTLTITAPYRDKFLYDAILRYELKYPDQKVKYDYEYESRDDFYINESNYGKRLTAEILANDIGDLLLTGGSTLVFRNLFETDAFMDLSELIENDKNYDLLNEKALDGITIDGAIRGLPVSVIYNFFEVKKELLEEMDIKLNYENLKWSDVLDLVKIIEKEAPNSYLFVSRDNTFRECMDSILEIMLIANMPDLIDIENKNVDINQEWFKNLMEKLKEVSTSKNFMQKNAKFDLIDQIKNALFVYRSNIETKRSEVLERYYYFNGDSIKTEYIPLFKGEKSANAVAKSINMYSINNRSENKENAWKFLSFLLEEQIQTRDDIQGTALNLEAEKNICTEKEKDFREFFKLNGEPWWQMMEPIYTNIDYMYDLDYFKNDIKAPILEYLQDKISLEEALKKAENNVWIRLNE